MSECLSSLAHLDALAGTNTENGVEVKEEEELRALLRVNFPMREGSLLTREFIFIRAVSPLRFSFRKCVPACLPACLRAAVASESRYVDDVVVGASVLAIVKAASVRRAAVVDEVVESTALHR